MATSLDTKLGRQIAAALIRWADREDNGLDGDRALHTACVLAERFTDDADFLALREGLQFCNHWDDGGWPESRDANDDDTFWRESSYAIAAGMGE